MTCSLGKTEDEERALCEQENGCISEGKPLHWPSPCLRYAVQVDGSPKSGLDGDEVAALVEQAFLLWQTAECPDGGTPRFEATFQGYVACDQQETVCAGVNGNVSVVMFHDEVWPYADNELGVTMPAAGIDSGVVHDADIELNAQLIAGPQMYELFPVIAHEVGHYLGLAHSSASGALMSVNYMSIGTSGELLTADDRAGICAIYPPSSRALSCAESAPAYDACKDPDPLEQCSLATQRRASSGGCSVVPAGKGTSGPLPILLGIGIGLSLLGRRRLFATRAWRRKLQRAPWS
jgi:hypothetical protein